MRVFHQRRFSHHIARSVPCTAECNSEETLNYSHLTGDFHSGWHITPNALIILGLLQASEQIRGCFPPAQQWRRPEPCPGSRESLTWVTHRAAPCSWQGLCWEGAAGNPQPMELPFGIANVSAQSRAAWERPPGQSHTKQSPERPRTKV